MHDSDRHDFHRKDCRCHRRAEQSGKGGAHSAHDHCLLVCFIESEPFAEVAAERTADLERRAFPADGCADEVGQYRRKENQHRHSAGKVVAGLDGGQHKIRAPVIIIMKKVVKQQNNHGSDGQQRQKVRIIFPKCGHKGDTVVK